MQTIKISELPLGTLEGSEELPFVDSDGVTKRGNVSSKANDADVVHKTGDEPIGGIKTFYSSPIVPMPTTDTQASTKAYSDSLNPDFYQYSITTSVSSGSLTVALKNYEGNDPTPTKPVKIMIGGVVRTITSALSFTLIAGVNYMNLGSSELATKEVDLFTYLAWNGTNITLCISRIPSGNTGSDFNTSSPDNERVGLGMNYIDKVVNIGRFNAILSAGPGYTWSLPATSVIINRPIYETRELSYNSTATCDGGATLNGVAYYSTYIIKGATLIKKIRVTWASISGGTAYSLTLNKPIQDNYGNWTYKDIGDFYDGVHVSGQLFNNGSGSEYVGKYSGAQLSSGSGSFAINTVETL